jgi:hypothetical protein
MSALVLFVVGAWLFRCGVRAGENGILREGSKSERVLECDGCFLAWLERDTPEQLRRTPHTCRQL